MTTATLTLPRVVAPATTAQQAQRFEQSFEQVYATLHTAVLRLARRHLTLTGSGSLTGVYGVGGISPEDIAQQTWLQVWRHWPHLAGRPMRSLASYVLRTTHHLVIDHQRRRVIRGRLGEVALSAELWEIVNDTVASQARETHPEAAVLDIELCAEARAALAQMRLSKAGRAPIQQALFDAMLLDEPRAQTSARLGMTEATVKTGQWRIRQALRQSRRQHRCQALQVQTMPEREREETPA